MEFLYIIPISYLLGSIPFAYLFVKKHSGKDLRKEGTGNIGSMNSYDVTGKKWIGITVAICDCLKAILAMFLAWLIAGDYPISYVFASFFVILGHNYNVFLCFRGGRGLAPALGCFLALNLFFPVVWGILWLIAFYFTKKDMHYSNAIATFVVPFFPFFIPYSFLKHFSVVMFFPETHLKIALVLVCFLVLSKHLTQIAKPILKYEKK